MRSTVDSLLGLRTALAGSYVVERELAGGGMATIYLARDLRHGRNVVVKVLRPELAAAVGAERFLREIRLTATLQHPHILPLYDSGEADGLLYYVTPYVATGSLRERLARERQLPVDEATGIVRALAAALDYSHRHGLVHRDVKPENILLEDGQAVLADFGIARAIDASSAERLTETGLAVGTPAYLSPEQATAEREIDGRSDVYSLGCVLYEMLAGEPPFTGPTAESIVRQHLTVPAPPVTSLRPAVPPLLAVAVARALAKTPADRFATAAQFADAVHLAAESGAPARVPARTEAAAPQTTRGPGARGRRVALGALTVLAAAVLGAGVRVARERLRNAEPAPMPPARRAYAIVAAVDGTASADDRAAARTLLVTALDQSDVVVSLPDEQLRLGLASAGKPAALPVDASTARELAIRGGLRTVIAPTVDKVGSTYHVAVRVLDADSGTAVVAERAIARHADDLIPTIDRVVSTVRRRLGERPAAVAASRPLEWAATPSLEAFRRWREAEALQARRATDAAIPLYREALALDPDFASAWSGLGVVLFSSGFPDSAARAWREALSRPSRLTEAGQLEAMGLLAFGREDFASAAAAWSRKFRTFGGTPNNLAIALGGLGRSVESIALLKEWERITPFGLTQIERFNLALMLSYDGRFVEARRVAAGLTVDGRARMAVLDGRWVEAESLAASVLDTLTGFVGRRQVLLGVLASAAATQGQAHVAFARMRAGRGIALGLQNQESVRAISHNLVALSLASGTPLSRADGRDLQADTTRRGRVAAALVSVMAGDTARASALAGVRSVAGVSHSTAPTPEDQRALLRAAVAYAREDAEAVTDALAPLAPRAKRALAPGGQLVYWLLADAYERRARLDSAVVWFGALLDITRLDEEGAFAMGVTHSFAHWRLARIHATRGDRPRSREHAVAFLKAFRQPDPELAWMVAEARRYASGSSK